MSPEKHAFLVSVLGAERTKRLLDALPAMEKALMGAGIAWKQVADLELDALRAVCSGPGCATASLAGATAATKSLGVGQQRRVARGAAPYVDDLTGGRQVKASAATVTAVKEVRESGSPAAELTAALLEGGAVQS